MTVQSIFPRALDAGPHNGSGPHGGPAELGLNFDYAIGRITMARAGAGLMRHVHAGQQESAPVEDAYDLIIPCDATVYFCQRDRSGEVAPGEYVLLNRAHFYELSSQDALSHWRISLPGPDLRGRLSSIDDHVGKRFEQNGRMANLLTGFVAMIAKTFAEESPPNPEALATEVIGFVMLVLASENRKETMNWRNSRYRLKQRIFDFVERNLDDAELSPKKIAKANRISPSYLYSLFSDNNTTVGQFIQARRLQKAYELLVADCNGALTVSEIAYQVGFKNASHFSRTFSRHFRIAPRDARQSGLGTRGREAPAA
ncbi:helix-turn-helix domain-containing protein [Ensifer soli]|uniref:helix-turn-helix domain-containing protein n=1 Tax=Ciceribacter sp. sgz301302 TaxID=3342379 RepID=UPI0035B7668D